MNCFRNASNGFFIIGLFKSLHNMNINQPFISSILYNYHQRVDKVKIDNFCLKRLKLKPFIIIVKKIMKYLYTTNFSHRILVHVCFATDINMVHFIDTMVDFN